MSPSISAPADTSVKLQPAQRIYGGSRETQFGHSVFRAPNAVVQCNKGTLVVNPPVSVLRHLLDCESGAANRLRLPQCTPQ